MTFAVQKENAGFNLSKITPRNMSSSATGPTSMT